MSDDRQASRTAAGAYSGASCPVLVGTTAVGKTAVVVALAGMHPVEVISLDSRQIYHGMRIGTAQPTVAEQQSCRHHLIDFVKPTETYSAAQFRRDFQRVFGEIVARGRVPLLVGGAGLYLHSLQEGLFEMPGVTTQDTDLVRGELQNLTNLEIRTRLKEKDRQSWGQIHPNDRYRNQRALEICLLTGRPLSELKGEQQPRPALGLDFPVVWLQRPAAEVSSRIAQRTLAMLEAGWLDETAVLLADYGAAAPGLQTIGYREICNHLLELISREEMVERIIIATRQYAKRQRTWFRQVSHVLAGQPENPEVLQTLQELVDRSRRFLEANGPPTA